MKKKSKTTMTKRFVCGYHELDTLAVYLEKQAADGWELTSKTAGILGFHRCEPRRVKVCVELVVPNEDDFGLENFVEYCEAAGWKRIFDDGKIQIFENEDLEAEPIHTDPKVKLNLIHKKSKRSMITAPIAATVCLGACWLALFSLTGVLCLSSFRTIGMLIAIPIYLITLLCYTVDYILWYRQSKKIVENGEYPIYEKRHKGNLLEIGLLIYLFIYGGSMVLGGIYETYGIDLSFMLIVVTAIVLYDVCFFIYTIRFKKDKKGNEKAYVLGVTLITTCLLIGGCVHSFSTTDWVEYEENGEKISQSVNNDNIPITLAELGISTRKYEDRSVTYSKTPWLEEYTYWDLSDNEQDVQLYYSIYNTKYKKIYDKLLRQEYLEEDYYAFEEIKDHAFHAEKVYYDEEQNTWLLLHEKQIISVEGTVRLNAEQMRMIEQALLDKK